MINVSELLSNLWNLWKCFAFGFTKMDSLFIRDSANSNLAKIKKLRGKSVASHQPNSLYFDVRPFDTV